MSAASVGVKKTQSKLKSMSLDIYRCKLNTLIKKEMVEAVRHKISRGIDVNIKDKSGAFPIHVAAETGNQEILKLLIDAGADVNIIEHNYGYTPLFSAKDVKTVKTLIEADADVNLNSVLGFNLLHHAVRENNLPLVKYLVESCKVDIDVRSSFLNDTALHIACVSFHDKDSNTDILKFLVKNNANLEAVNHAGQKPLKTFITVYSKILNNNYIKFYKFLLKYSDVTEFRFTEHDNLYNFMSKALWKIYLEHVSFLLSLGITINSHQFLIDNLIYCKEYFEKRTSELSIAKSTKLRNSWVTFFNILTDSNKKLKNYAGNEDLVNDFKNTDFSKKFPIYGAQMQEKVDKEIKRRRLFDKYRILLSNCLPIFNPNHLIISDTLDFVISTKDLLKFCNNK